MPLQRQTVSINLARGLDTKTDKKMVTADKLLVLENSKFKKGDSLSKRNGYTALGKLQLDGATSLTNVSALGFFGDELLAIDGNCLCSYLESSDAWINKGFLYNVGVTSENIIKNSSQQSDPQVGYLNNILVFAWEDSRGGIRASITSLTDNQIIVNDTELSSTGINPKIINYGGKIYVYYIEGTNFITRSVAPVSPSFSSATTLSTNINGTNKVYDVVKFGALGVVAYNNTAGNTQVSYITTDPAIGTPFSGQPSAVTFTDNSVSAVTVFEHDETYIHIIQHNANGLRATVLNADFTTQQATTTLDATTSPVTTRIAAQRVSSTDLTVYYTVDNSSDKDQTFIRKVSWDVSGTVGTSTVLKRSVGLAAKGFTDAAGTFYLPVQHQSTLQSTSFIINASGAIVSKFLGTITGDLPAAESVISDVVSLGDDKFMLAKERKGRLQSESGVLFTTTGVAQVEFDLSPARKIRSEQLGASVQFTGGIISGYDGAQVYEQGFNLYPENIGIVGSASGGNLSDGTRQYILLYEWTDARGQIYRSTPSVAQSFTLSGGGSSQKATITFPTLRMTARESVSLVVYRTENNGATFYRVTSVTSLTLNDTTVDSVSIEDTLADASITSNEILYTTGNVLENASPPTASIIAPFKNRTFLLGLENKNQFAYSKEYVQGDAVNYAAEFIGQLEDEAEEIVAGAALDDNFIIFKETNIFAIVGNGPDATGLGETFSAPKPIPSRTGCDKNSPNSVVTTPIGLMYKSSKGIYLLDRGLNAGYIGAPVEEFNNEDVLAANVITDDDEVRFLTSAGNILTYNYYYDRWSVFKTFSGAVDTVVADNIYYLSNTTTVLKEDSTGLFTDDNSGINQVVVTPWYKFNKTQGFQRVRKALILGEFKGNHIFKVSIGYDFHDYYTDEFIVRAGTIFETETWGDNATWGSGDVWGGSDPDVFQLEFRPSRQKCQAIRFKFEDIFDGNRTEGFELSNIIMEVAAKKGAFRLPASQTIARA